jgi:hypothetical protein
MTQSSNPSTAKKEKKKIFSENTGNPDTKHSQMIHAACNSLSIFDWIGNIEVIL